MTTSRANLINSISLIVVSLWGYFVVNANANEWEWTPLIPVVFGVILFLCNKGLKNEDKVIAHIVVVLTLVAIISLVVKPLQSALADNDGMGVFRVSIMIFTGLLAMITFVKSFIANRKSKQS